MKSKNGKDEYRELAELERLCVLPAPFCEHRSEVVTLFTLRFVKEFVVYLCQKSEMIKISTRNDLTLENCSSRLDT